MHIYIPSAHSPIRQNFLMIDIISSLIYFMCRAKISNFKKNAFFFDKLDIFSSLHVYQKVYNSPSQTFCKLFASLFHLPMIFFFLFFLFPFWSSSRKFSIFLPYTFWIFHFRSAIVLLIKCKYYSPSPSSNWQSTPFSNSDLVTILLYHHKYSIDSVFWSSFSTLYIKYPLFPDISTSFTFLYAFMFYAQFQYIRDRKINQIFGMF